MSLLSSEAEQDIKIIIKGAVEQGIEDYKRENPKFPYLQQAEFMKELKISITYLYKLIEHGLKRVVLEEGDRTVWYSLDQARQLMDSLAE